MRLTVVCGLVPALAVAAVAGGRQPGRALLATASTQPGPATDGPALPPVALPDGFHRPGERPMRSPASVSGRTTRWPDASVQTIPDVALVAYQQGAAVIDTADLSCHLDWSLLAAIGQVESDHGRAGGSHLDAKGVATPRIIGPRLDGRRGTAVVRDTDAGRLDGDNRYDHAVGPMQFLPSTWAVVAVDADGDGRRNVEDVNDAALGSAVYLCAGADDLATPAGARAALLRYNHSASYAATVLAIAHELSTSSLFAGVTTGTIAYSPPSDPTEGRTTSPRPSPTPSPSTSPTTTPSPSGSPTPSPTATTGPSSTGSPVPLPTASPTWSTPSPTGPTTEPTSTPPTTEPTTEPTSAPPSTSPTGTPQPPVIPDPLPRALADLTPAEVEAFNAAWPACLAVLPDGWTAGDVRRTLAEQLDLSRQDSALHAFAHWVGRHRHRVSTPAY